MHKTRDTDDQMKSTWKSEITRWNPYSFYLRRHFTFALTGGSTNRTRSIRVRFILGASASFACPPRQIHSHALASLRPQKFSLSSYISLGGYISLTFSPTDYTVI